MMKALPICINIFLLSTLVHGVTVVDRQKQQEQAQKGSYKAVNLYALKDLNMVPTSVQLLRNPISSNEMYQKYDLAWMAYEKVSRIKRIEDVGRIVDYPEDMLDATRLVVDGTTLKYPNSVGVLPPKTIEKQPSYVWWVAAGMFGKTSGFSSNQGGIYMIDLTLKKWDPVPIYLEQGVGFHHAEWIDMDLDQRVDCLTVKGSANSAQLLWLQQPSGGGLWKANPISNGTDVGGTDFRVLKVRKAGAKGKKVMLIVVAGKRNGKLTAHWIDDPDNDWTQTTKIRSTDISGNTGRRLGDSFISVEVVDLNADGIPEILTSVAEVNGLPGRVVAFLLSKGGFDPSKTWRRKTLTEWPSTGTNFFSIFPGPTFQFFVSNYNRKKPHILVSGADRGSVYVLSPKSWSPVVWTYTRTKIFQSKNAIGIPAVGDVDGEGKVEIFIPSGNEVIVNRYQLSHGTTQSQSNAVLFFLTLLSFSFLMKGGV